MLSIDSAWPADFSAPAGSKFDVMITFPRVALFRPLLYYASVVRGVQPRDRLRVPRAPIRPFAARAATSRKLSCWPSHRNRRLRAEDCFAGAAPAVLIVTAALAPTFTCRLAISEGRQPALAGTVIEPSRQASHTPAVSAAPVRDRTTSRQRTFNGTPRIVSRILVPHDAAVRAAVACTWVARFTPANVTGGCPPGSWRPVAPTTTPTAAATHAARPVALPATLARAARPGGRGRPARCCPTHGCPGLLSSAGRSGPCPACPGGWLVTIAAGGTALGGTLASRPGIGARRTRSRRQDG